MQQDAIVDIKESQVRYFGTPGKMLLPSQATVESVVVKIPAGRLLTTDQLRAELARRFGVQGTCPVTTRKALAAIASQGVPGVPYWRVIKKNGELVGGFPGGVEGHAALLIQEGFTVEARGKARVVVDFRRYRVDFSKIELD